ncbi:hypothetical protein, partial [Enterococcus faecalis]
LIEFTKGLKKMYLVIGSILIIFIVSVFISTIGALNEKIKNKFYLFVKFSFNISIACIFLGGISFLYAYFVFDAFKNFKIILISIFLFVISYKGYMDKKYFP